MTDNSALPPYPPPLSEAQLDELKTHAVDWALAHGLVVRAPTSSGASPAESAVPAVTHAPVALFPSPFPRKLFEQALVLQPLFNELVDNVARDHEFLTEVMDSLAKVDDFTGRLYDIYKRVHEEGISQSISLGLHRSDYLLHVPADAPNTEPVLQQVELNTIASSFSSLSHLTHDLHRFLAKRTGFFNDASLPSPDITLDALPENTSIRSIAKGIGKAWELYEVPTAVAVMIVQPGERNAFDQRWIEYKLFEEYNVPLLRLSLAEMLQQCKLNGTGKRLMRGNTEIAVVYYRAGYAPTDFPSQKEWDARLLIERSKAIKCPNIAHHLVGTKKVQQILAKSGLVERFIFDKKKAEALRASFTGLYELDDTPAGHAAAKMALENPGRFVMKPQREGGGNNIYGDDIPGHLSAMSVTERNAYILMDMIRPPQLINIMVRHGALIKGEVVSELGIYGLWLSDKGVVHLNENGGHLLRTKAANSNEGGVAAGFAVLDSPLLI
ncbi:glutathione synthase [Powellomyces hirtus]|uniref:Glutathione synthetase n=1 Tax=Powellomyces hirtus TaxID=109895 RepID=A0A507EGT7_9FUNG|nr:glutathione synthase [Powellomyces hirtus]